MDERMSAGKPPLGHINPFLYQNPTAFNDIKKGKNNGGGLKSFLPGFEATTGWPRKARVHTSLLPVLLMWYGVWLAL